MTSRAIWCLIGVFTLASVRVEAADYDDGGKFEPPTEEDGTAHVLHGVGQWQAYPWGNPAYEAVTTAVPPASSESFFTLGDTKRPWDQTLAKLHAFLDAELAKGRIPRLGIALHDNSTDTEVAIDPLIPTGVYDARINDLGKLFAAYGYPLFVRIGFEFNGDWNGYTPYIYPKAFQYMVEKFRGNGAFNVATSWCGEAAAPADFGEQNSSGEWKWYPGDDAVDWACMDVFNHLDFQDPSNGTHPPQSYQNVEAFLAFSGSRGKPVSLDESSAVDVAITTDAADGANDWAVWFAPFFTFIKTNPIIKSFNYANGDWTKVTAQPNWSNANIATNAVITANYVQELQDPRYLNAGQASLVQLNDYLAYAPGVHPFGKATASCAGTPTIGVSGIPKAGNGFAILGTNAPANAKGYLIISDHADAVGTTFKKAVLHVSISLGSQVSWVPMKADGAGKVSVALDPGATAPGTQAYAQLAWPNTACGNAKTWNASAALDITVQP